MVDNMGQNRTYQTINHHISTRKAVILPNNWLTIWVKTDLITTIDHHISLKIAMRLTHNWLTIWVKTDLITTIDHHI